MNPTKPYYSYSQAERLIAMGRMILSAFFLLAIWLEPSEPSRYARLTYSILAVYVVYSVVFCLLTWRSNLVRSTLRVATHSLDLLVFALLMFLTDGPSSPFFVYFIFLLICATLRWQWRGTLWTAAAALTVVVFLAWYTSNILHDQNFELNRFIIRTVYLAVVAMLLGYLGMHEQSMRSDLSLLAQWPRSAAGEIQLMLGEMLEHAAAILRVPRVLLIWEEAEEPWLFLAHWSQSGLEYSQEHPEAFGSLVAEQMTGSSFFCHNAADPYASVVRNSPADLQRCHVAPLQRQLQERFRIGSVLAIRLAGEQISGYLFALDRKVMTVDDLVLGEIVVQEAASRLEHYLLLKQLQQVAVTTERVRLARDLHDGLLQSLAGAALHLETAQRLMETEPQLARQQIREIQQLLVAEQRDLRSHIGELRPFHPGKPAEDFPLAARLEELAERIRKQWDLSVDITVVAPVCGLTRSVAREIYFVVHESLINAVRHAGASALQARLSFQPDRAEISVSDNGHGFSFHGRYDQQALLEMKRGPVTLRERIAALGGTLCVDSQETGTRLEITLPLAEQGG